MISEKNEDRAPRAWPRFMTARVAADYADTSPWTIRRHVPPCGRRGRSFVYAIEDVDVPGWEPIGPQKANPGPFYLVWTKPHQQSLETHPRPWQLAAIEIVRFEDAFPRTVPAGLAETDPGWKGFAVFKEQCVHCHAMNRQGGRVGPELNVPRSIVEYRPVDQIKAYIKDPLSFRYSTMPAHPTFSDADLDAVVAYFTASTHDLRASLWTPGSLIILFMAGRTLLFAAGV